MAMAMAMAMGMDRDRGIGGTSPPRSPSASPSSSPRKKKRGRVSVLDAVAKIRKKRKALREKYRAKALNAAEAKDAASSGGNQQDKKKKSGDGNGNAGKKRIPKPKCDKAPIGKKMEEDQDVEVAVKKVIGIKGKPIPRIPRDPEKVLGCGKCRFTKRGCARCGIVVASSVAAKKNLAVAKPIEKPKKKPAREAVPREPNNTNACQGALGCSKCRFSKRGCARCIGAAAVKATVKAAVKIPALPRPRKAQTSEVTPVKERKTDRIKKASQRKHSTASGVGRRDVKGSPSQSPSVRPGTSTSSMDSHDSPSRDLSTSPTSVIARAPNRSSKKDSKRFMAASSLPKLSKFVRPVRNTCKARQLFREPESIDGLAMRGDNDLSGSGRSENSAPNPTTIWKDPCWWNPCDVSCCVTAKNALHMSSVREHVSVKPEIRSEEWSAIRQFVLKHLQKEKAGSIYVSGVPGSGKTFIVQQAINSALHELYGEKGNQRKNTKLVHINCMTLQDPKKVFGLILEKGFQKDATRVSQGADTRHILSQLRKSVAGDSQRSHHSASSNKLIVVLDEVDHLVQSHGNNVLYDLFALSELPLSKLVFIGIANSIDLTLRLLPHLHTMGIEPSMVNFRAYSHDELFRLLQQRLDGLDGPVFDPKALELCSRKVAAASGDMRQCLNAVYAALETHILHWTSKQEGNTNENARPEGQKRVDLQQMSLALGKCLKLPLINGIRALPQHQQMILCSLTFLGDKEIPLQALFSKYADICQQTKIPKLHFSEFGGACVSLHDQGLVATSKKMDLHSKSVKLKVKHADIVFALQGIRFFHNLLNPSA